MKSLTFEALNFCLSGRIFERTYDDNTLPLEDFFMYAMENGFKSVELRDSQICFDSGSVLTDKVNMLSEKYNIPVEMITARKGKLNDEAGYEIYKKYLRMAANIKCGQIKVSGNNIRLIRKAADDAAQLNIKIGTNNHIGTEWETIEGTVDALKKIDHPNFFCHFDPSHLWLKKENISEEFIESVFNKISYVIIQDYQEGNGDKFQHTGERCVLPLGIGEKGSVGYGSIIRKLFLMGYKGPYGLVFIRDAADIVQRHEYKLKSHCMNYINQ
ncbi:MAG: hypothetical protein A2017_01665 [Lentisphaerae bacterium GWF2_44_16]|nr:MAG: hypothetical protein A2017_01665 [Lentisphaerae bacterium GWF2_44_16]